MCVFVFSFLVAFVCSSSCIVHSAKMPNLFFVETFDFNVSLPAVMSVLCPEFAGKDLLLQVIVGFVSCSVVFLFPVSH